MHFSPSVSGRVLYQVVNGFVLGAGRGGRGGVPRPCVLELRMEGRLPASGWVLVLFEHRYWLAGPKRRSQFSPWAGAWVTEACVLSLAQTQGRSESLHNPRGPFLVPGGQASPPAL